MCMMMELTQIMVYTRKTGSNYFCVNPTKIRSPTIVQMQIHKVKSFFTEILQCSKTIDCRWSGSAKQNGEQQYLFRLVGVGLKGIWSNHCPLNLCSYNSYPHFTWQMQNAKFSVFTGNKHFTRWSLNQMYLLANTETLQLLAHFYNIDIFINLKAVSALFIKSHIIQ